MVQDLNLPLDVMAAVPVRGDLQGQPLKLHAVIFAHRSLKMFAQHIVQNAPVPAGDEGCSGFAWWLGELGVVSRSIRLLQIPVSRRPIGNTRDLQFSDQAILMGAEGPL